MLGLVVFSALIYMAAHLGEITWGHYASAPLTRAAAFLARMNPHLDLARLPAGTHVRGSLAYWFYDFPTWARALCTSLEMALVATLSGGAIALVAALAMTRATMPSRLVRQFVRRALDLVRTLPDVLLALLLVQGFGPGTSAGVCALTIVTTATLARPFSEAFDNADLGPMEALCAAGANRVMQVRYGLVPLVAPALTSLLFIFLEANLARACALGIVGAGGIGTQLSAALAYDQLDSYAAMLVMIVALIMLADLAGAHLRRRLCTPRVPLRPQLQRGLTTITSCAGALIFFVMCLDLRLDVGALAHGVRAMLHLAVRAWPPTSAGEAPAILHALVQTLAMAFLGTCLAATCALPLALLAARTVLRQPFLHFLVRRVLDIGRAIPALIWALLLVAAFGMGPRVGVLAIVLCETPILAKLFAEVIEHRPAGPIEALRATGASPLQVLRYGLVPHVAPIIAGLSLFLFEINMRTAATLGLVGAGGIGVALQDRIGLFLFDQVAWILLLFAFLALFIDTVSQALRQRLSGASPRANNLAEFAPHA